MIHAPRTGEVVKVEPIGSREITAIRRVIPDTPGGGTGIAPGGMPGVMGANPLTGAGAGGSVLPAAIVPQVRRFESLFVEAGRRWGIDPVVLAAQAQKESGGNVNAVSPAGARGLMQFMPATAAAMGVDPLDPASAVNGAARYMSEMLGQFGSLELALAAYNAGPGAVRRAGNRAPYAETIRYVQQVMDLVRSGR
jgi:soluble lytic murein transglycosylase-like protein